MSKTDLHIHTIGSDGSYTPKRIVKAAFLKGLTSIAITDHDSIEQISNCKKYGIQYGIQVISGIEFTTVCNGMFIHIIGLFIDEKNYDLNMYLKQVKQMRKEIFIKACKILNQNNYRINLQINNTLSKIKDSLLNDNKTNKKIISDINQLYNNWKMNLYNHVKIIELIHSCKGLAFLAHPNLISEQSRNTIINNLIYCGIDGIECFHPSYNISFDKNKYIKITKKNNLLYCGGSDFHNETDLHILGRINVPDTIIKEMQEKKYAKFETS